MNSEIVLPIENGFLRVLKVSDVHEGYVNGLNEPLVNRYLDTVKSSTQTTTTVSNFVTSDLHSSSSILWGIWTKDSEYHVGTIRLSAIDCQRHRIANIGICLFDKNVWGKGLGSAAISAVTHWAMTDLGLHWIEAGVWEENTASQRAFLSAGYEWNYDIAGKYIFEGSTATSKFYVAHGS